MALIGDFSDTSFADLIQLYAGTRQTVAVTVNLPDGEGEDGVFYVENGEIVDAWLGDARGRTAIRRALALGRGAFVVQPDVRSGERTVAEPWRQVLLEELVRLDEERRAGTTPTPTPLHAKGSRPIAAAHPAAALAQAAGAGPVTSANGAVNGAATPTPARPLPPPLRPGASAPLGAAAAPAPSPAPGPAAPASSSASPPAARSRSLTFALAGGAAAAIAIGVAALSYAKLHPRNAVATAEAEAAPAAASAAAPLAKAVPAVPTISFGMAAPLFGSDKELGRGMKAGILAAFATANEAGGIHGKRLELVALDDGNDPAKSAQAMKELVERRDVLAVIGNAGTATAAADVPVALEHKVPLVGALAGGPALRKDPPDRYVFVYRPGIADETAAAVRYLVEVRRFGPRDIAFFGQDDEFGEAAWAGFARAMKERQQDPARLARLSYRRSSSDVDAALKRLRSLSPAPKAVVMAATHAPAARFIELAKAALPATVFTNVSSVDATALAERLLEAKVPLADDVVVTQVVPAPDSRASATMKYRGAIEKYALGERPGYLSLEGWVVGTLVVEALKRAGGDVDREKLVDALEGLHDLDIGIGAPLAFSKGDHQASHKVWGTALAASGAWRPIDLE
jgi:ABC-type branched-subunit amino acid transport system substrate-binding protein